MKFLVSLFTLFVLTTTPLTLAANMNTASHSKVVTKVSPSKDKTKIMIDFMIQPNPNMGINLDGPWSLTIDGAKGGESTKLSKNDYQEKLPGFSAEITAAKGTELKYTMVSFICTADKKTCYRDVHKGTVKL